MKKNIYFLGIGGIGMSALAQYYNDNAYNVAGYDKIKNNVCQLLENEGINIHYEKSVDLIPEIFKNPDDTLVVITPAVLNDDSDNKELLFFKAHNFDIKKRAEILGLISNKKNSLAISGAHGKTSITTICANNIYNSPKSCTAFLGGISKNFASNFVLNNKSDIVVLEADEYDRSFLFLNPTSALISYLDPDHLDIYLNYENLFNAFVEFANNVKENGNLILSNYVPSNFKTLIRKDINVYLYSYDDHNTDFYADNIRYKEGKVIFDIVTPKFSVKDINYKFGGRHNIENAVAGSALSVMAGLNAEEIKKGLELFDGVQRRFDIKINKNDFIYIDDYAHHPNEIKAFLTSVKKLYPNKKITAVFQPHLFSRTKDFYEDFAHSLNVCDEIILLPIYPAREKPMEGVSSELILNKIENPNKKILEKNQLMPYLINDTPELLVTMGAGDIDQFVTKIVEELK